MDKLFCPKCKTVIEEKNINGLFYSCPNLGCDFVDDSTLEICFKYGGFKKI